MFDFFKISLIHHALRDVMIYVICELLSDTYIEPIASKLFPHP